MPATDQDDLTLAEIRAKVAPLIAENAAFDGWSPAAVAMAAEQAGLDPDVVRLAFPGGAPDMIDAWFASVDRDMAERLPLETLAAMKIRTRIAALVEARLDILAPNREALRRALSILALPGNVTRAAKLNWRAADIMWRRAGDRATDYNHYTKRGLLSTIYAATLLTFLNDESEGQRDTRAFLARRIEGVMWFEKTKAQMLARTERLPSLSRFIGRLRYPAV